MNITPLKTDWNPSQPVHARRAARRSTDGEAVKAPSESLIEKMKKTIQQEPTARPEMIAKAKALAADPNYPGEAEISGVASIFLKQERE